MVGKVDKHNDWVDGSGATEHIICNKEFLENVTRKTVETLTRIRNGDHIHVEGKGSCILQDGIKIDKVLYIPSFSCNFLYVSRLTKNL